MENVILSILISTYNRSSILKKNLTRMLDCMRDDIEFIISDNNSTDETWEMLSNLNDRRLKILHNEMNMGILNVYTLPWKARGVFFVFVNDRDYIPPARLNELCDRLEKIRKCDIIALCGPKYKREGYYGWKDFLDLFFSSNHPGNLIYLRKYYTKIIDKDAFDFYLSSGNEEAASSYITERMVFKTNRVYYSHDVYIVQPQNRNRIPQTRKEVYGCAYILPEYFIRAYDSVAEICLRNWDNPRVRYVYLAFYKNGLIKVTSEYRKSMKDDEFRIRNHCEDRKASEWFRNGVAYTRFVLDHDITDKLSVKKMIIANYIRYSARDMLKSIEKYIRSFLYNLKCTGG